MRCYVCEGEAVKVGGWEQDQVDCTACGSYAISGWVLTDMNHNVESLNVAATRDWLTSRREAGEARPVINTETRLYN